MVFSLWFLAESGRVWRSFKQKPDSMGLLNYLLRLTVGGRASRPSDDVGVRRTLHSSVPFFMMHSNNEIEQTDN